MASALDTRLAGPADAAEIVALVNGAYRGTPEGSGWTSEAALVRGARIDALGFHALLGRARSVILTTRRAGRIVGCAHLEMEDDVDCRLGMLSTLVGEQAAGVGKSTLAHSESYARDTFRARRVVIHVISVRAELLAWYERRGYRPTGEMVPFPPRASEDLLQGPLQFARLAKAL